VLAGRPRADRPAGRGLPGGAGRAAGALPGLPHLPPRRRPARPADRAVLDRAGRRRAGRGWDGEGRAGGARAPCARWSRATRAPTRRAWLDHRPPAALRPGDGQGARGHRVLPLPAPAGAQRGRRRARRPRLGARGVPRAQRRAAAGLAGLDAGHRHPRHQAGRGRARRLAVLSELPGEWAEAVRSWRGLNGAVRPAGLHPQDEYTLYQALVGAWPADLRPTTPRDWQGSRSGSGLPHQGLARGQGALVLARPGRRLRGGGAGLCRGASSTPPARARSSGR
jgi:hypothetical protein